jgi:hypothetical protein
VFYKTGASAGQYNCSAQPGTWTAVSGGGGSGTVTSVSGVTANGFSFSIANPTTTPAITLTCSTCITGTLTPGVVPVATGASALGDSPITDDGATIGVAARVLTGTNNGLGATSADGLVLQNTTAAANGAQQFSPRLRLTGRGWKASFGGASRIVDWVVENQPIQGSTNPTANLVISSQVNAGGYVPGLTLTSASVLNLGTGGSYQINGTPVIPTGSSYYVPHVDGNVLVNGGIRDSGTEIFIHSPDEVNIGDANGTGNGTKIGTDDPARRIDLIATGISIVLNGSLGTIVHTGPSTFSTSVAIGAGSPLTSSGAGGALGTNAFTSTAYLPLAGGTLSGDLLFNGVSAGSATLPMLSSFVGNATQYIKTSQSAGLISFDALGSATNIGFVFTAKGNGSVQINTNNGGNLLFTDTAGTPVTVKFSALSAISAGLIGTQSNHALYVQTNATGRLFLDTSNNFVLRSDGNLAVASSTDAGGTKDTNLSRISAGLWGVGTGAQGSFAGDLKLNNILVTSATDSTTTTSGALQVAGGAAIRKRVFIDGITASSGLQTAVLCQSSGGEMIADSVACLASSKRFKENIRPLTTGLDEVMKLQPISYRYKPEGIFARNVNFQRERVGFLAEDINAIDPRFVGYEADGKTPRTVGYEQMVPLLVKAIQEMQSEIDTLRQQVKQQRWNIQ